MFQLDKHEADFSHLNLRKENHGDDKVPAATLTFKLAASALILDSIDKKLRPAFYEKPGKGEQQALPIDGNNLTALKLPYLKEQKIGLKSDGYELTVAPMLDHGEPLFFADAELVIHSLTCIEGGSVELVLKVNTCIEPGDYAPLLEAWDRGDSRLSLSPPSKREAANDPDSAQDAAA